MAKPSALSRSGGGGDDQIATVESEDFHALFVAAKDADATLYKGLRKAMREAGAPIVADVRAEIDKIPSSGKHRTGIRTALKAGTRVAISTSAKSAGIRIVTSPSKLPPNKRGLAKAMNRERFRHPVFGRPGQYAEQAGRPYFGAAIDRHRAEVRDRIEQVMVDTAAEIERRVQ